MRSLIFGLTLWLTQRVGPALLELTPLQAPVAHAAAGTAELRGAERVSVAAERAAEIGDAAMEGAIETALDGLNTVIGGSHTKLIHGSAYGDVKLGDRTRARLEARSSRSSGTARSRNSPPQEL